MAIDNKYGNPQIERVPDDEPIFIIRAQDKAALDTIDNYSDNAEFEGASEEFLAQIDETMDIFRKWQESHETKIPD